jgi:alpha-methylacyl-CoA racemase
MSGVGVWSETREANLLDGAAPFYGTYRCADDRYVAVGAIEPQFYAALLRGLELDPADLPDQHDRAGWRRLRARFAEEFARRPRDAWAATFVGTDACVTPVLSLSEAPGHPHLAARGTLPSIDGIAQAAPAPRFSRTVPGPPAPPPEPGAHTAEVCRDWQISADRHLARIPDDGEDSSNAAF